MRPDPVPAPVRRRNRILGLALGAVCLLIITAFILVFNARGLPKDPAVWKRMQQDGQVQQP